MKAFTGRATMYGYDGCTILVTGPRGTMKVPKSDAVRLAGVCLKVQGKYALVSLKRYNKDLRELRDLRKLVADLTVAIKTARAALGDKK